MSYHLIDVELVLSPRQLSVAGCELTNEVMATGKKKHTQAHSNLLGLLCINSNCFNLFMSIPYLYFNCRLSIDKHNTAPHSTMSLCLYVLDNNDYCGIFPSEVNNAYAVSLQFYL